MRRKNPVRKSAEKSGGPKIKIREKKKKLPKADPNQSGSYFGDDTHEPARYLSDFQDADATTQRPDIRRNLQVRALGSQQVRPLLVVGRAMGEACVWYMQTASLNLPAPSLRNGRRGQYELGLFTRGISSLSKTFDFPSKWSDSAAFSSLFGDL